MARIRRRRGVVAVGAVLTTLLLVLLAPPASAQVPPGAQATPLVGASPTANCPPGSPGAVVGGTFTSNGVTVGFPAGGRCTPSSADAEGSYTVVGSFANPLGFTAECHNAGGTVQTGGGVVVPAGTLVNGVPVAAPTTITAVNTPVTFPGGRTAILNQVIVTPTAVTRNAIVFTGGPIVGQVICGAAAYPLAVESASGGVPAVVSELSSSGNSGSSTAPVLAGGAMAVVLLLQVVVARRMRRRPGAATA
jgi:hypothetical protein